VEDIIERRRQIGGDDEAADHLCGLRVFGPDHKDAAGEVKDGGAPAGCRRCFRSDPRDADGVVRGDVVCNRAIGLLGGEPQHLFAERGDIQLRRHGGRAAQAKALNVIRADLRHHLLASPRLLEEGDRLAHAAHRLLQRDAVPALEIGRAHV
jgi:hypothetical protein